MAEPFFWGQGGAKLTPEQLALARAVLARKKSQGVDTSPVGHWTAGAARVVDALGDVVQERRLNNLQAENDQYNVSQTEPLIAAISGASAVAPGRSELSTSVPSPSPVSGIAPSGPVAAEGEIADYIRQSASARGIDPDIALRVAMSEGGVKDPVRQSDYVKNGVREASYGPFQLYMGGGLGNKALEAGVDPRDPNQWRQGVDFALDQAATGGWSPWYGAAKVGVGNRAGLDNARAIGFNPQPASTPAAAAIEAVSPTAAYVDPMVSVRPNAMAPPMPAPVEVAARPVASAPMEAPPQAPQQSSPPPAILAQALRVMADPRANENTKAVAQALIQRQQAQEQAQQEQSVWMQRQQYAQQQQQNDPMRQLQMQEAQLKIAAMQDPNANVPDAVKSLDLRAQRAGLQPGSPEYNNFFITQGVKPPANVGAPPAGYQIKYDAAGNPASMEPIPGSPAALEAEARTKMMGNQQSNKSTSSDVITNAARLAREAAQAPGLPATGMIGGVLSGLPETNAAELRRQVGVLTSNATVENLNAMRAASPTGGALGSVTEKEGAMLAAKSGALDPNSPNFARDLEDYERTLLRVVHGQAKGDEIFNQTRPSSNPDIQAAKDAIAKGANRDAVIKRLQDAGIDTEGL